MKLFSHVRCGLAFNALSTYVDYFDDDLFYFDPEDVFNFCKEQLSTRVTLRNDYLITTDSIPFEFTVYIYKSDIKLRKKLKQIV